MGELISIIVPVYNVRQYLTHCLESIAHQSYCNLDIVLVDDGSTDGSGDVCDEFANQDERVRVIHQENMGLWAARNTGQRAANGEYMIFIDSDDYIHRDMIMTMYNAINEAQGFDWAMIDYKKTTKLDEDVDTFLDGCEEFLDQEEVLSRFCRGSIPGCVWNKLFRRSVLEGIFAGNYQRAQDQDYCLKVFLRAESAVLVHKVMYFWVQRPGSHMHRPDYLYRFYHDIIAIYWSGLSSLSDDQVKYEHYLLEKLYRRLVLSKAYFYGTDQIKEVKSFCDVIRQKVSRQYWHCKDIPFFEKTVMSLMYYCPGLVFRHMTRTGNWKRINN